MFSYLTRRLIDLLIVLFGVSVVIFMMIRLIPGDAVAIMLGANAEVTPDRIEALRKQLGLDQPLVVQYWNWLTGALRGDLGKSVWTGMPVREEILARLPVTLELTGLATLFAVGLSIPVGVLTAYWRGSRAERAVRLVSIVGITLPSFWVGTLLIFLCFVLFPRWPTIGYVPFTQDPWGHLTRMILPVFTVSLYMLAALSRLLRSSLLEVLGLEYIRTARSKGLSERVVVYRHALRNAMIPLVTAIGIQIGYLFGGSIVIEQVFALPGMGRLIVGAINERNYPLVQGTILLVTTAFVVVNLLVDLIYAKLDPRVEYA
jgi:peptide/nickel transport system permease protein